MIDTDIEKDIEELLGYVPSPDEDLLEAGLDSVRLMKLASRWDVSIVDLAEEPTLAAWQRLTASSQPGGRERRSHPS